MSAAKVTSGENSPCKNSARQNSCAAKLTLGKLLAPEMTLVVIAWGGVCYDVLGWMLVFDEEISKNLGNSICCSHNSIQQNFVISVAYN